MNHRHRSFQQFVRLLKREVKSTNIIVALTELSILIQSQGKKSRQSGKNIIDVLELYGKTIAEKSLGIID